MVWTVLFLVALGIGLMGLAQLITLGFSILIIGLVCWLIDIGRVG